MAASIAWRPGWISHAEKRGYGAEVQKYVYSKIYNAEGFKLCSEMPRFGHIGAVQEERIRHLVALLLDPESPVNK